VWEEAEGVLIAELHDMVARVLADPAHVGIRVEAMYSIRRVPSEMRNGTEIRRKKAVSTVTGSQASMLLPCARRSTRQDEWLRFGAG
jgi:hypothetical protein